jgi:hypothetical protein
MRWVVAASLAGALAGALGAAAGGARTLLGLKGPEPERDQGPLDLGAFPIRLTPGPEGVQIAEQARFQHVEILGSSGTGKNYHGLLPMIHQDIVRGAGVLVIDPKGAMRNQVTAWARACGRAQDLRCLDLADPSCSGTWNPFLGDDPLLVAERVHAALYAEDATATSFYRDTALGFFHLFFSLCRSLGELPTPDQLRQVAMDQAALGRLALRAPASREAREWRVLLLRQSPLEYARSLQGVVNALTPLCSGALAPLFNTASPAIDLGEVLWRSGILYAGLASDQYPSLSRRVGTLLLTTLHADMTRRYASPGPPAFLYLDEFADLVYPEVRALVAKAREARVGITLAHQSLGDLARHGRAIADAIFENTSNKVLLRIGSADSAEVLARLSGGGAGAFRRGLAVQAGGVRGPLRPRTLAPSGARDAAFDTDALMDLAVGEAFLVVQRPWGRELFRGRLSTAPESALPADAEPWAPQAAGPARRPLVLAAGALEEGPASGPRTPLAEAALARMRRGRARGA